VVSASGNPFEAVARAEVAGVFSPASDNSTQGTVATACRVPLGCQTPSSAAGRQMYVVMAAFFWVAVITQSVAAQTSPAPPSSLLISGPTFDEGSVQRMKEALATYSEIESRGGWPALPQKASLSPG
jgi:hypothetical protein